MEWQGLTRLEGNVSGIAVIGAGGIGARVIPALIKMVMPGTNIVVVDPDVVEERNLVRQHFTRHDVGRHKAEVMADRYHTANVPVIPVVGTFGDWDTTEAVQQSLGNGYKAVIAGIDNRRGRDRLRQWSRDMRVFYIDAGNDGNGGQVVLGGRGYFDITGLDRYHIRDGWGVEPCAVEFEGWRAFPDIFDPSKDEADVGPSCGYRIDTQTVLANMMAAQVALNFLQLWLYRMPILTVGATFSTLNNIQPIKFERLMVEDDRAFHVYPEGEVPDEIRKWREERIRQWEREWKSSDEMNRKAYRRCRNVLPEPEAVSCTEPNQRMVANYIRAIHERTEEEERFLARFDALLAEARAREEAMRAERRRQMRVEQERFRAAELEQQLHDIAAAATTVTTEEP